MFLIRADDDYWPADIDRTVAAYNDLGEALRALGSIQDDHERQCVEAGESPTQLALVLVDDAGTWYGSQFAAGPAVAVSFSTEMRRRL